jgi:hypothetical protein
VILCPRDDTMHMHTAHVLQLTGRHGREGPASVWVPHGIVPRRCERLSGGHA